MALTAAKLQVEAGYKDTGANRGLDNLDHKIHGTEVGLKALGVAALGAGATLGAAFAATVLPAAEFEKTMSGVKAVSGATGEEMKQLSALALQLGKDTVFSASEAAQGLEELVKGGISVQDVMGGAAAAALNLATAGSVPLVVAAEQMSDAMNIFSLKGTDAAHAADLIAGAANASSMTVTDFGFALKMAGAVAKISGQDFDSTATAIAVMAQAGLKGSDAGTSLKTMMLNLQPTTKRQIDMFKQLGIVTADGTNLFIDQAGKMKPLAEISQILQEKTAGLTAADKVMALEMMFGTDAIRAAAIMSEAGAAGFAKMSAEMSKVTAVDVARERLANLAGDMEQMKGSAETLAIMIGGTFTPMLRDWAKGFTGVLNAGIDTFDGLNAHAEALLANGLVATKWEGMLFAISEELNKTFGPETAKLFEGFTKQAEAAGEMFSGWMQKLQSDGPGWVEAISTTLNNIGSAFDIFMDDLAQMIIAAAKMKNAVGESFNQLGTAIRGEIDGVGKTFDQLGTMVRGALDGIGKAIDDFIPDGVKRANVLGLEIVAGIRSGILENVVSLAGWFKDRVRDVIAAGASALGLSNPFSKELDLEAQRAKGLAHLAADLAEQQARVEPFIGPVPFIGPLLPPGSGGGGEVPTPTGGSGGIAPPSTTPGPSRISPAGAAASAGRQAKEHIEKAKPEVLAAIDGFMSELTSSLGTFQVEFGATGGALASNLALGFANNTPAAGAAIGRSLQKLVSEMGVAGIEDFQQRGDDLAAAIHESLVTPSEEATLAVHALIIENVGLIDAMKADAAAMKEAEKAAADLARAWKPGQGFFGAVTEVARDQNWVTQFGEAGSAAVSAFTAAWDGDHNAEAKAANAIQRMIGEARKAGVVDANAMGGAIIEALGMALQNGDEGLRDIGFAALAAYSASIDAAKLKTAEMAADIKKMVEDGLTDMKRLQDAEGVKIDVQRERDKIDRDLIRKQAEIRAQGGTNPSPGGSPAQQQAMAAAGLAAQKAREDLDRRVREQEQDRVRKAANDAALAAEKARLTALGKTMLPPGASPSAAVAPLPVSAAPSAGPAFSPEMQGLLKEFVDERPIELDLYIDGEQVETTIRQRKTAGTRSRVLA